MTTIDTTTECPSLGKIRIRQQSARCQQTACPMAQASPRMDARSLLHTMARGWYVWQRQQRKRGASIVRLSSVRNATAMQAKEWRYRKNVDHGVLYARRIRFIHINKNISNLGNVANKRRKSNAVPPSNALAKVRAVWARGLA